MALNWTRNALLFLACSACGTSADSPEGTAEGSSSGAAETSGPPASGTTTSTADTSNATTTGPQTASGETSNEEDDGSDTGDEPEPEGELLFFDDFEYEIERGAEAAMSTFVEQGGWTTIKDLTTREGANGYLYTAPNVPGSSDALPGLASSRALVIESLAFTAGGQTDFYLQYGNSEEPEFDETLPGDVWIQFWFYANRSEGQQTGYHAREKFIYPCNGPYPCDTNKWLFLLARENGTPEPAASPGDGAAYVVSRDNMVGSVDNGVEFEESHLGQTDTSEHLPPNRWSLVRIHYDTSGEHGTYEAWIQPRGGAVTKVAEWISGETPGFTWTIPPEEQGGHRAFRMPTTLPGANHPTEHDAWIYVDDFAVATSADALPTYEQ